MSAAAGSSEDSPPRRFAHWAEAWALVILTIALALFFVFLPATSETFPTVGNLRVTLGAQSVLVIVAMGALIPLISGHYDFSVGAVAGLASVFCASSLSGGDPIPVALAIGVGVGLIVGAVNGLLVTVARVDSVVVTLGTATIVAGAVTWKTDGVSIVQGIPDSLTALSDPLIGIPKSFFIAIAVVAITYVLLRHTAFGRYVDAIGSNLGAARLVGLNTNRLVLTTFLLSGALAGLAGLIQVAVSGAGNPQVGENFTLPAIAAAFLSVAAIKPGRFNVWGTLVAIIFLAVLNSGLNLAGASSFVSDFANGGALIVGVALAATLGRRRNPSPDEI